jgi:hypothetical protein
MPKEIPLQLPFQSWLFSECRSQHETSNVGGLRPGLSFIEPLDMDRQQCCNCSQVSTDLVALLAMDGNCVTGIDGLWKDPITRLLKDSFLA